MEILGTVFIISAIAFIAQILMLKSENRGLEIELCRWKATASQCRYENETQEYLRDRHKFHKEHLEAIQYLWAKRIEASQYATSPVEQIESNDSELIQTAINCNL